MAVRMPASPSLTFPRVLLAGLLLIACALLARPAQALEFSCIEPSRYRNLLAIFSDDPNQFFGYFGLPRGKLPPTESCRAILATGEIREGDSAALLKLIDAGGGWLAVLYLAADGTNLAEEIRLAAIIRAFQLKTRTIRTSNPNYTPDFVAPWNPAPALGGEPASQQPNREDITPLARGLRAYGTGRSFVIRVPAEAARCNNGCRVLWHAGINRLTLVGGTTPVPEGDAMTTNRRRVGMLQMMEFGRLPAATDPLLSRPLEWNSLVPGTTARLLREKCAPEFSVVEALEARWSEAFDMMKGREFRPGAVEAMAGPFEAIAKGGARLQQCLATAFETERLKAFEQHCPKGCDQNALLERFTTRSREWMEAAERL